MWRYSVFDIRYGNTNSLSFICNEWRPIVSQAPSRRELSPTKIMNALASSSISDEKSFWIFFNFVLLFFSHSRSPAHFSRCPTAATIRTPTETCQNRLNIKLLEKYDPIRGSSLRQSVLISSRKMAPLPKLVHHLIQTGCKDGLKF